MALDEQLQQGTIADLKFRAGVLAMRWLMLLAYVVFADAGVLEVSDGALFVSASMIFAYDVFHAWLFFSGKEYPRINAVTRYTDVITITIALIALQDIENPVWVIYFISIVSMANLISRREMIAFVLWTNLNYLAVALALQLAGQAVSWSYFITISVLLQFMGFTAGILAGGQERLRDVIAQLAVTDSLTGVANRRRFHDAYVSSLQEAVERRLPLALMLIDVDHFKEINDTHGHPAGDDKLREVADALKDVVRTTDLVARYGGDEFVVVAPGAPRDVAMQLAERLREAAIGCGASVSIGVAIFPEDAGRHDALMEVADAALYRAKQAGRNCVRGTLAAA